MEVFEQLLEDYALDADIQPPVFHEKIRKGLIYWEDLELQNLELEVDSDNGKRINKTVVMQNILTELSQLIMEDSLTGLYNRRYFNRALKNEVERSSREHRPLGLAIIDIDHFKKVNDTWGHDGGDEVLKVVANLMGKNVRQSDTLIRIGGEEFAVIMPNIRHRVAKDVMERLRLDIENSVIPVSDKELRITVSIGVTVREANQFLSADNLYKQADLSLYEAKESGRNKVVLKAMPTNLGLSSSEREALAS